MSNINTGGPAFPSKRRVMRDGYATQDFEPVGGMTLRDYFAAKALPAEMARWPEGHPNGWEGIAAGCYAIADAMLKAREGK